MKKSEIEVQENKPEIAETFKKENLMSSARYLEKRDIINALLEDDREYTLSEVDGLVEKFMKGKVE